MWGVTDTQGLISKGRQKYSWLFMWGVTDTQGVISIGRQKYTSHKQSWLFLSSCRY
jgi:hypothetical protein